ATKVVVFLTDGRHTAGDSSKIPELSNKIFFKSGAAIIAIGFGAVERDELRNIAIPDEPLIFDDIGSVELAIDQIVERICAAKIQSYEINFDTTSTAAYFNITINIDLDNFNFCFSLSGSSDCIGETITGAQTAGTVYQFKYEGLTPDTAYSYVISTTIGSEVSLVGGIIETSAGQPYEISTKVGSDYVEFNFEFFKDVNNLEICFKKVGTESCISNNISMSKSLGDFSSGEKYSFSYAVTASTDYAFEVTSDAGSS
ncbi:hypothetical protein, partial [Salmonella sp. s51228]|uniref:hypothetical protein n=1 Tax=Salmonella sp. s51228 TaxID=3159652 RepID=UPI00398091EB